MFEKKSNTSTRVYYQRVKIFFVFRPLMAASLALGVIGYKMTQYHNLAGTTACSMHP